MKTALLLLLVPVLAFIMVPANVIGPNRELSERLHGIHPAESISHKYLTHYIYDEEYDPVLKKIHEAGLHNLDSDRVKIIFTPGASQTIVSQSQVQQVQPVRKKKNRNNNGGSGTVSVTQTKSS